MQYAEKIKNLTVIPGVGKSIANDLIRIGVGEVKDLVGKDPEDLYNQSNTLVGTVQDRCLLYVFRCAVYFAEHKKHDQEKLKWWNWKDEERVTEKKLLKKRSKKSVQL